VYGIFANREEVKETEERGRKRRCGGGKNRESAKTPSLTLFWPPEFDLKCLCQSALPTSLPTPLPQRHFMLMITPPTLQDGGKNLEKPQSSSGNVLHFT